MHSIGQPFTILESVDSTNNYAMAQVHEGVAKHGSTYFALLQTAGKGQRGRSWHSNSGENIAMSVVLEPEALISEQFLLSCTVALACYDFVNMHTGEEARIKWPNDVYWRDRKAGGILIENLIKGNYCQYAIAGMGLNINQTSFPGSLANPVSLKQITGKTMDVLQMARQLCSCLQLRFEQFRQKETDELLSAYNAVLYKSNETVALKQGNVVFKTVIKGVNRQGYLITRNAVEQQFSPGEVTWVKQ